MDPYPVTQANDALGQETPGPARKWLWILLAIVIGMVVVIPVVLYILLDRGPGGSGYLYIPSPRNTLMTTSLSELPYNILMDANDTAVKYSVVSRTDLSG